MTIETRPPTWKTVLAFAIIYLVWGSTFLAIRVGVREVPPLILAAMRFAAAGAAIYFWLVARGEKSPSAREWISASLLGIVIFVFDYGLLFWAEQRVPSGIAAVILATIPVFMTLSEIIFLRTQRLTARLALALLIGIGGVALLMIRSLDFGGAPVDKWGAMALIFAAISWSIASAVTRKVPLPKSKVMSSGAQMLSGGIFLAIAAALTGEYRKISSADCVARSVAFVAVFDCRGIDHRVHRVCVAATLSIADKSWDVCVRESDCGGDDRIFLGRRRAERADSGREFVYFGERGGDYDDAGEEGCSGTRSGSCEREHGIVNERVWRHISSFLV